MIHGYLDRCGIRLNQFESDQAFYSPDSDSITIPLMSQFHELAEYYSTLFHEATHSTGHESRLNRFKKGGFGSAPYSREELIAELGASFLLSTVGLDTPGSLKNNAAYIQNWLKVLRNDKKLIVIAAGKAEKAVSLILGQAVDS